MANIMIVDDEPEIIDLVEAFLAGGEHTVYKFYTPSEALAGPLNSMDIAVLDVMLPEMDGFTLCRKIREKHQFPIIMLTARDGDTDKISGLTLGADDYVVKPFNPLELVARINAQLRRSGMQRSADGDNGLLEIRGLHIDEAAHICTLYGREIALTPTEFAILVLLAKHKGKVISSEEIFASIWQEAYLDSNNTVMVHIQKLRKKLGDTQKKKQYIQTVWGVGYKLEE